MADLPELEFATYVEANHARLVRFAYLSGRSRQDAEDVVQEVLIKMGNGWARILSKGHPDAYIRRALVNRSRDSWRARRRRREEPLEYHTEHEDDARSLEHAAPELVLERKTQLEVLHQALKELPRDQCLAVLAREHDRWSWEETADLLHVSVSTAKRRHEAGLRKLRELMEGRE